MSKASKAQTQKKVIVIGAGFAGISVATTLADKGYKVQVLEKHNMPGGRARVFEQEGFRFDMGPSWYWMPDVFDRYFERFGKKVSDYYTLERLDPSYTICFGENDYMDIPADMEAFEALLESIEKGSAVKLRKFLKQAAYKYQVGINDLVYKPSRSVFEFMDIRLLMALFRMDVFKSIHKHIRKFFKHPKIIQLMEFPILFLGALPKNTPALYSLMNYADIKLGTWYPKGGMFEIVKAMVSLAEEKGVEFIYNASVDQIVVEGKMTKGVRVADTFYQADLVVAGADYQHVDQNLLKPQWRNYSEKYWNKRFLAPSSLIYYIGVDKKLEGIHHHTLFFDTDFSKHAHEIYTEPQMPSNPLFYTSTASKTDPTVAPEGCDNLMILIPVAPDLEDTEENREKYYDMVMDRFEKLTGQEIRKHVVVKRSYAHKDFIDDYNAYKGNAYGLANTLRQTAILKPSLKNKKVKNLYYTGQLTVPGPGVPPSLISGQVVAKEIVKEFPL